MPVNGRPEGETVIIPGVGSYTTPANAKFIRIYAVIGAPRITTSDNVTFEIPATEKWEYPYDPKGLSYAPFEIFSNTGASAIQIEIFY